MKVIGFTGSSSGGDYIVQLSHYELERAFEKGYGNLTRLSVGSEVDLATMPEQRGRIVEACRKMEEAYKTFIQAAPVMAAVAQVITRESQEKTA